MAETIDVWRLFALPDGTSSMERIQVTLRDGRSSLFAGKGVQIVVMTPNREVPWHTGPRRQMIAILAGTGELETGDGQKLAMQAGTITLIEDLTGQGHITRNGPEGRLCLFLPLDEDTPIQ